MIYVIASFVKDLDPAIKAAIIGSLTTAVAGIMGLMVLVWRLRREAQHAIDENKSTEAMKLKLKIYEQEVVTTVERVIDAQVALAGFVRRFMVDLAIHMAHADAGLPGIPPVARIPAFMELKSTFDQAAIEIVTFTERWFVIDPRFEIFRIAINAALYDVNAEYEPYFNIVMRRMPVELQTGFHWTAPTKDQLDAINTGSNELLDRLGTMTAYVSDFQVEMQNILVGPLFGRTVPHRQPIDPRHVVIVLDNDALLTRYFREDTAWGRAAKATDAGVRAGLST